MRDHAPRFTVFLFFLCLNLPLHAQAENQPSAWEILLRENAAFLEVTPPAEKEILKLMTPSKPTII